MQAQNAFVAEHVRKRTWWGLYVALVAAALGYIVLGYATGWAWTGLSKQVKLWDWLEGLALPITVGLVPLLLKRRQHLQPVHKTTGLIILAAFVVLVLAGYLVPWDWTGFTGNTLWDWLSLALLPVVIATASLWQPPPRWPARHVALLSIATALAIGLVLAGYLVPWKWTGFTDNTAWDWIKLLLLPVLVPTVLLPRLLDVVEAGLRPVGPVDQAKL